VGDSIQGHRIIAESRKISDPVVIVKSARHKAQRIVLAENALAIIDRKDRWSLRNYVIPANLSVISLSSITKNLYSISLITLYTYQ
jgi:hypothetical protein